MAAQSALAKLGQRLGVLGSAASLAICAPLAAGDYSMDAHTDASRMGWYFDRTIPGSQFIGHVVEGVDVLHVATDVIASVVPITAVTNTGYTRLDSTVDAGGNTYFQYDHSDGTILLQSEIMGVFPLMQVNDNTVTATGSEEAFKVTTYASKAGLFQVSNDTVTTSYAMRASAGIGNANAIQAYVGAGIGTAAVVHIEDDRATQGYSIDGTLAGQAKFVGVEYIPQAANPGGGDTLWIDSGTGDLMLGASVVGGGGGTIGGTIAVDQVAVGSGPNAIAGSTALLWTAVGGLTANRSAVAGNEMFGSGAGNTTMTGINNTLVGLNAGTGITSATGCTAIGSGAFGGTLSVSSANSTAIGYNAMSSAAVAGKGSCTAVGANCLANVTSSHNTAVGNNAGGSMTASTQTTAVGSGALIGSGGTVSDSTAVGYRALTACQAQQNTAVGSDAADSVTTSTRIVAVGYNALGAGVAGVNDCTAIGHQALLFCTVSRTTAIGSGAADALTTSTNVTAVGYNALGTGTTQITDCTAVGCSALAVCVGDENTAVGANACLLLTASARNVAIGDEAMGFSTTGVNDNTAVGHHSLRVCGGTSNVAVGSFSALALTTSDRVIAIGYSALDSGTTGVSDSVAIGHNALTACTVAENIAIGSGASDALTTSLRTVSVGFSALGAGTTGISDCTAVGHNALLLATGDQNTAVGSQAASAIVAGIRNSAFGHNALLGAAGSSNTAIGANALVSCTASENTAVGSGSALGATTATHITAVGFNALSLGSTGNNNNTAVGWSALSVSDGANNTAVGSSAGEAVSTSTNVVAVGALALQSGNSGISNCVAVGASALNSCTAVEITAVGSGAADALTTSLRVTAIGFNALGAGTIGLTDSTAVGHSALALATGANNTAVGALAGDAVTSGASNTLVGSNAGGAINTGSFNAAIGDSALFSCQGGVSNVGLGTYACYSVTSGNNNLGIGTNACSNIGTTDNNVGVGYGAMQYTTVTAQVAIGMEALRGDATPANNTGTANVAIGFQSLRVNAGGAENVAVGYQALVLNTSGSRCVGIGTGALAAHLSGTDNTALGWAAGNLITTGVGNIFIGAEAGDATAAGANNRLVAGSDLANITDAWIGGNGETNAAPITYSIRGTGGAGTDIAGGGVSIRGGAGTGTGATGNVAVFTAPIGASSATPNALVEAARFDASTTATHTRFMIYDVDNGTLERVTVGAADSGGSGFKVLRIPN